jgi:hypothetical protein
MSNADRVITVKIRKRPATPEEVMDHTRRAFTERHCCGQYKTLDSYKDVDGSIVVTTEYGKKLRLKMPE